MVFDFVYRTQLECFHIWWDFLLNNEILSGGGGGCQENASLHRQNWSWAEIFTRLAILIHALLANRGTDVPDKTAGTKACRRVCLRLTNRFVFWREKQNTRLMVERFVFCTCNEP